MEDLSVTMLDLQITWKTLLTILSSAILLSNGIKLIISFFNPYKELKKQVEKNTQFLDNDHKRMTDIEAENCTLLNALFVVIDHMKEPTEELRDVQKELRTVLTRK